MFQFNRNDPLNNSNLLPPAGGFNFIFTVSFIFIIYIYIYIYKYSLKYLCLLMNNTITRMINYNVNEELLI